MADEVTTETSQYGETIAVDQDGNKTLVPGESAAKAKLDAALAANTEASQALRDAHKARIDTKRARQHEGDRVPFEKRSC